MNFRSVGVSLNERRLNSREPRGYLIMLFPFHSRHQLSIVDRDSMLRETWNARKHSFEKGKWNFRIIRKRDSANSFVVEINLPMHERSACR